MASRHSDAEEGRGGRAAGGFGKDALPRGSLGRSPGAQPGRLSALVLGVRSQRPAMREQDRDGRTRRSWRLRVEPRGAGSFPLSLGCCCLFSVLPPTLSKSLDVNRAAGFTPELVVLFSQMEAAESVRCSDGTSNPHVTYKKMLM